MTRKITLGASRITRGLQEKLVLGNLSAGRDWGFAGDYVEGMWQMLQQHQPDDYVLATGETHTVEEFASRAFDVAGLPLHWEGEAETRRGIDSQGLVRVEVSPEYYRPAEVDALRGNAEKARSQLHWSPRVSFDQLVEMMVQSDMENDG